jgi:hypothetical protein
MRTRTIAALMLVAAAAGVRADNGPADERASEAAFARLKTLVGRWQAQGDRDDAITYQLVAGGTALVERDTGAGRPEMVTMYHLDGARLLLTHYCMAGNQPRMQLQTFDPSTGELKFEFVDATNLASPAAGHMHAVAIRLAGPDEIATEWQFYENGRAKMTETTRFTRVR